MNKPNFDVPVEQVHRGNDTSRHALEATAKSRATMVQRVYSILKLHGEHGAIPEDISGRDAHIYEPIDLIDVRRAFHIMKKRDLIVATGEERLNPKGHYCEVWKVK